MPAAFADARGLVSGTIAGDTNTDSFAALAEPAAAGVDIAVPSNLIVQRRILAYSKSTAVIFEMPAVGTVQTGTVLPNASLAVGAKTCYRLPVP